MRIRLYTIAKKHNSTKIPNENDAYTELNVVLKTPCSLSSPTFILSFPNPSGADNAVPEYTYAGMFFNGIWKYYFIDNVTALTLDKWMLNCSMDVLGTYWPHINEQSAYVLYSSNMGNTLISDSRAAMVAHTATYNASFTDFNMFTTTPSFVLHCIGKNNTAGGFATAFYMTAVNAGIVQNAVNDPDFFDYVKQFFNSPMEGVIGGYISTYNLMTGDWSDVNINGYNTGAAGQIVDPTRIDKTTVSVHPKTALRMYGDYRDLSPYAQYTLKLPFVGVVPLDSTVIARTNDLIIECSVAPATGDIVYVVNADSDRQTEAPVILGTYSGSCMTSTPVTASGNNQIGFAASLATVVAGGVAAFAGEPVGGLSAISSGLSGAVESIRHHSQINGAISSHVGVSIGLKPTLQVIRTETAEAPTARRDIDGLPCGRTLMLSTLSGYAQLRGFSADVACEDGERSSLNNILNGGFYIE